MQPSAPRARTSTVTRNVTCPFCALLCDDLVVERDGERLRVTSTDCPAARAGFEAAGAPAEPRVNGKPATLEAACAAAARILRGARAPLFAGLATDVAGQRQALALAERTGGFVDHLHGDALARNLVSLQDGGWITTTLTEVRNRADLLLFLGTDARRWPRFFERMVWTRSTLFDLDPKRREIVFAGARHDARAGRSPSGRRPTHLRCDNTRLGELVDALRTLLAGRALAAERVAGIDRGVLERLGQRLSAAAYPVLVWAPGQLDFPHAELVVQSICALVRELNERGRAAGLSLGGDEGAASAAAVSTWLCGYPLRIDFGAGHPEYDPMRHSTAHLLGSGRADTLVWISSFDAHQVPPAGDVPRIVLAHPRARIRPAPEVLIPVGIPGVDHDAQLLRGDGVVALGLARLRPQALPSAASALAGIAAALDRPAGKRP